MKNITKKIIAGLVCSAFALTAAMGFAACKKKSDPNTIVLWAGGQWVGSDAENLKAFTKWYNAENKLGLTINLQIKADFEQSIVSAMQSGTGPDLMVWDRFNTPTYATYQNLEPIDDLIARDGVDKNKFNATAYNEMSYGGVQYGLPLDLDLWGIYINMDIVDAYNKANSGNKITCLWNADGSDKLDWAWDDVLDVAGKLKGFTYEKNGKQVEVKNGYNGCDVQEFFIHNYFSTGQSFLDENGKAKCNNAGGVATLQYLHSLRATGSDDGYKDNKAFVQGNVGLYMRPTYFTSFLSSYAKSMRVRFMPQPKSTVDGGKNRGVMGGYGMAMPRPINDKDRTDVWEAKKARCWEFMKDWLYNEANMQKWADVSKTIPALTTVHNSEQVQANTVLRDAIPFAAEYTIRPGVSGWTAVQVNVFNVYVKNYTQGNINSVAEAEKTLAAIERDTNATLASYK